MNRVTVVALVGGVAVGLAAGFGAGFQAGKQSGLIEFADTQFANRVAQKAKVPAARKAEAPGPASAAAPASPPAAPPARVVLSTLTEPMPKKIADFSEIAKNVSGLLTFSANPGPTALVFFNPSAPESVAQWKAAQAKEVNARIMWAPVALGKKDSLAQGVTVLAAAEPLVAMQAQMDGKASPVANAETRPAAEKVKRNSELFKALGGKALPFVVVPEAAGMRSHVGVLETSAFIAFIKPSTPPAPPPGAAAAPGPGAKALPTDPSKVMTLTLPAAAPKK